MLEIFAIIALYRKLASLAEKKHRSRAFGWLGPGFWLVGEFMGSFTAGIFLAATGREAGTLVIYPFALLMGGIGALIAYLIVRNLSYEPLRCPACMHEVNRINTYTAECSHCDAAVKIVGDKVEFLKTAS